MADAREMEEDAPRKKRPIVTLIKAVAVLSVLVVVEVVTAALVIPSPQETETLARELAAARHGSELRASGASGYSAELETEDVVEMEIGQFSITRYNVDADTTINVDFEVFVTVLAEDEQLLTELFEANRNRVREQVNLTVQAATLADLNDRGLGLIKRQILEKINRVLGRPLVREVLLTRFNFVPR